MNGLTKYALVKDVFISVVFIYGIFAIIKNHINSIEYVWNDPETIQGIIWFLLIVADVMFLSTYLKRLNIWIKHFIIERGKKKGEKIV